MTPLYKTSNTVLGASNAINYLAGEVNYHLTTPIGQQFSDAVDLWTSPEYAESLLTMGLGYGLGAGVSRYASFADDFSFASNRGSAIHDSVQANLEASRLARRSSNIDEFFAKSAQVESGYHPDMWFSGNLKRGDVVYALSPNDNPQFFTTLETLQSSGFRATTTSRSLQIKPHDVYGYRLDVTGYRVNKNFVPMQGNTLANPQFGPGAGEQFFIRNSQKYLEPISTIGLRW